MRQSRDEKKFQLLKQLGMTERCVLNAGSSSMEPLIEKGDGLVMKRCDLKKILKADVVAYYSLKLKRIVAHRVAKVINRKGEIKLMTRGDANYANDKELVEEAVFIGVIEKVVKRQGRVEKTIDMKQGKHAWLQFRLGKRGFPRVKSWLFRQIWLK